MLQEILENDDFCQVSSARRLENISGTVKAIDLKFSQVKNMGYGLLVIGYGLSVLVYSACNALIN
jgi:hypothetical protein